MSIKVDASKIIINNANGTEKFNSDNKLVYRKFTQTGSLSFGSGTIAQTDVALSGSFNPAKDVALVYTTVTAANGNVSSQVVGSTIQLSFSLLTHFEHATTYVGVTAWDMLTAAVIGDLSGALLRFDHVGYAGGAIGPPVRSISLNWKLVVLSYR